MINIGFNFAIETKKGKMILYWRGKRVGVIYPESPAAKKVLERVIL